MKIVVQEQLNCMQILAKKLSMNSVKQIEQFIKIHMWKIGYDEYRLLHALLEKLKSEQKIDESNETFHR